MGRKSDVPHGTLDVIILKTLDSMGPLHGFGIARRIEQAARDTIVLNQGTIYPALVRLQQRGWVSSKWGISDSNRRARYYSITAKGRGQLAAEKLEWLQAVDLVNNLLEI